MFPNHMHVLRSADRKATFGFRYKQKPYMVGFVRPTDVTLVSRKITFNSEVRLMEYDAKDITKEVRSGLESLGIQTQTSEIFVDDQAILRIEKRDSLQFDWMIEQEDLQEFLSYPFSHATGIAIATQMIEENDAHLLFRAEVVEPSYERNLFQKCMQDRM